MVIQAKDAEMATVLNVAQQMCVAARTAPKARGIDYISTCIVTGEEKDKLAGEMERFGAEFGEKYQSRMARDAGNVRNSQAVVLIGTTYQTRGLGDGCALCNFKNCAECAEKGAVCVYDPMDLGIAVGSAVAMAADMRVDNRVMFTIGKVAIAGGYLEKSVRLAMGIPLSATGKSPFFDR